MECEAQVKNFPGARYKKFVNAAEAESFARESSSTNVIGSSIRHHPNPIVPIEPAADVQTKEFRLPPENQDEVGWDVAYCDGACRGNGQSGSVAGIGVWWGHNDRRNLAERCPGDQTNNRAELIAIARILETAPRTTTPLLIKTDSMYSINCFKSWLKTWERNDYRTAQGQPVKNLELILYIQALLDSRARSGQKIRLHHVRGHVGITGNEEADSLANRGALLPPEQDRDWIDLRSEVLRKVDANPSISMQSIDINGTCGDPGADRSRTTGLGSAASSPSGSNHTVTSPRVIPLTPINPDDIDCSLYADCLLDEDEIWRDLVE
ncbi:hypothetical protein AX15_004036 [Amanita polypyramis BW_CC]|nr:hypothetical protein AX15_004036 [Amanita polypyramis BW_CC]